MPTPSWPAPACAATWSGSARAARRRPAASGCWPASRPPRRAVSAPTRRRWRRCVATEPARLPGHHHERDDPPRRVIFVLAWAGPLAGVVPLASGALVLPDLVVPLQHLLFAVVALRPVRFTIAGLAVVEAAIHVLGLVRSEERRVGKECRSRGSSYA